MSVHKNYLHDLGALLKEYALDAKMKANQNNSDFAMGYLLGYHGIISLMQQQAETFGIPYAEIGLHDIDPDTDLV